MPRWIRQSLVVFRKEVRDGSRDRRAVFTLLFSALFTPLLLGFMLNRIADRNTSSGTPSLTNRPNQTLAVNSG